MLEKIKKLRKELHQNPELSGHEMETAKRIRNFIVSNHNTEIIDNLGGNGLAAIYSFSDNGPVIMIRCELDALPIEETNLIEYRSKVKNVSHKCGHDGHMAIVAGLIFWIKEQQFKQGKIILLFQPAEETGVGAHNILNDPEFKKYVPDYIFALHNIPGEPLNSIIMVEDNFSSTVQSISVKLTGKESHAAEPEKGINPSLAIAEIIKKFFLLNVLNVGSEEFSILTPVHLSMGKKAYGTSAGSGEIHYTLRTWTEKSMKKLKVELNEVLVNICRDHRLQFESEWFDYFPTAVNDSYCNEIIRKTAKKNNYELIEKPTPFRFGEDFGWFSQNYKTAMFGIGAGKGSPALHHADYDFPDEIIDTGINMFTGIIELILNKQMYIEK
ncbi:MAG: amidohydrolase [Acidobacteriota bacterium]